MLQHIRRPRSISGAFLLIYRLFSKALTLLLYTNLHVGAVAASWISAAYKTLHHPQNPALLITAATGAILVYGLDQWLPFSPEDAQNQPERAAWMQTFRLGMGLWLSLVCLMGFGATFYLPQAFWEAVLLLLGLSMAYILPFWQNVRLKKHGRFKPILVWLGWMYGGFLMPIWVTNTTTAWVLVPAAVLQGAMLWVNLSACDWLDRNGDQNAGICTSSQAWSKSQIQRYNRQVLALASLASPCLTFFLNPQATWGVFAYIWLGLTLMTVWLYLLHPSPAYRGVLDALVGWPLGLLWL